MSRGKRGRPGYDEYMKRIGSILRKSVFELDDNAWLAQLPGIKERLADFQGKNFPVGTVIQEMFTETVIEIIQLGSATNDRKLNRISIFLDIWYIKRLTVTEAAQFLKLSRSVVAHNIQPLAIELVARRFLDRAYALKVSA